MLWSSSAPACVCVCVREISCPCNARPHRQIRAHGENALSPLSSLPHWSVSSVGFMMFSALCCATREWRSVYPIASSTLQTDLV